MSHDARGERDKAVRRYQETLALKDFAGSHDRARRYLDQPYGRAAN